MIQLFRSQICVSLTLNLCHLAPDCYYSDGMCKPIESPLQYITNSTQDLQCPSLYHLMNAFECSTFANKTINGHCQISEDGINECFEDCLCMHENLWIGYNSKLNFDVVPCSSLENCEETSSCQSILHSCIDLNSIHDDFEFHFSDLLHGSWNSSIIIQGTCYKNDHTVDNLNDCFDNTVSVPQRSQASIFDLVSLTKTQLSESIVEFSGLTNTRLIPIQQNSFLKIESIYYKHGFIVRSGTYQYTNNIELFDTNRFFESRQDYVTPSLIPVSKSSCQKKILESSSNYYYTLFNTKFQIIKENDDSYLTQTSWKNVFELENWQVSFHDDINVCMINSDQLNHSTIVSEYSSQELGQSGCKHWCQRIGPTPRSQCSGWCHCKSGNCMGCSYCYASHSHNPHSHTPHSHTPHSHTLPLPPPSPFPPSLCGDPIV